MLITPPAAIPAYISSETSALILGITAICALVCYLKTNLSPGGLIVPGVLVLTALEGPVSLATTVAATAACYGLVFAATKAMILYGKRLFVTCLITSLMIELLAFMAFHQAVPQMFPHDTLGFLVPGLMSYQFFKQKIGPTLVSTSIVTLIGCGVAVTALVV